MFPDCSPCVLAIPVKVCSKCGEVKPANGDHFRMYSTGRLEAFCRVCSAIDKRLWREANPDRVLQSRRAWARENPERKRQLDKRWRDANPDKVRAASKAWYEANHDLRIEVSRSWRAAHRDKSREYTKAWRKNNPQKRRIEHHRRRARKRNLASNFCIADWRRALDYFGGCCAVCGRPPGLWHTLAADHWIPLSKGGLTSPDNIVPLCHGEGGCNNSKYNKDAAEWLLAKFGKRKGRAILRKIETYLAGIKGSTDD